MNAILKRALLAAAVLAAVAVTAGSAAAHHGFALFDTSQRKTIVGTVKQFEWTNPHTWVWLDVPNDKGGVDTWGFEGMSPNFLGRRGWTRTSLKPGDKITATYMPMKDGSKGGELMSVKLASGQELIMFGGQPADER